MTRDGPGCLHLSGSTGAGTAAWPLKESGIYSPCGQKAETCSWAASLGDAKSQPRLFTTVFLSWLLALDSSVTTLWSASQEPELSFQLAGTLGLCCILLCLPGCSLFRLQRVFPTHSLHVPVLGDDHSPSHGVFRLPALCVLLFICFSLQLGLLRPAQRQGLKHPVCKL